MDPHPGSGQQQVTIEDCVSFHDPAGTVTFHRSKVWPAGLLIHGDPVAEARVTRADNRGWLWELAWYWPAEGPDPGVYDRRRRVVAADAVAGGFAWTRLGAWWALARAYHRSPGSRSHHRDSS